MLHKDIHEVYKIEEHYLPTCPCEACHQERQARAVDQLEAPSPIPPNHIRISPVKAYLLGLIPRLNPHGSVAREVANKQAQGVG